MSAVKVQRLVVGMVETNCYLIYNDETKRAVIIDPGDAAEKISGECKKLGLKPEAILLTHGHFDHMMAAPELKEEWNIPIYAAEKEMELLMDGTLNMVQKYYRKPFSLKPDHAVHDGDTLELAGLIWKVMETPGHTSGSCCYYLESEGYLFSGDTLFQQSYGRVDFPTGSSMDMLASVKRLLQELPEETSVCPGHMDETTIAFEKKYNPLARF